jgi:hypothetical protein
MNPKAPGRAAILGRHGQGVWDFLSLSSASSETNFTKHPHLTLNVSSQAVEAMVTVPHGVNTVMRRNIVGLGEDGFREVATNIVKNLKPLLGDHKDAAPWFRGLQRRYPTQRAVPVVDATIEFDLRTACSVWSGSAQDPAAMAVGGVWLLRQKGERELSDSDGGGVSLRALSRASEGGGNRTAGVFPACL